VFANISVRKARSVMCPTERTAVYITETNGQVPTPDLQTLEKPNRHQYLYLPGKKGLLRVEFDKEQTH